MWQRYPAQTSGRLAAKDFVPSVLNASLHWDGSTYYSTLFHELVHSTGHESRLNSSFGAHFGDELYSKEEVWAARSFIRSGVGWRSPRSIWCTRPVIVAFMCTGIPDAWPNVTT